ARSLPSSRIVYLTLIPVCFVNSDGVSDAMSCICGLATMATLIVFPAVWPDAVVASAAAMTISATNDEPTSLARFRTDRVRASSMTNPPPMMDVGWFAGCFKVTAAKRPRDLPAPRPSYGSAAREVGAGTDRVVAGRARWHHRHACAASRLVEDGRASVAWETGKR